MVDERRSAALLNAAGRKPGGAQFRPGRIRSLWRKSRTSFCQSNFDCHKSFEGVRGNHVWARWFGITKEARLLGKGDDGRLCVVYTDGTDSEWILPKRLMTEAEKLADDKRIERYGAGPAVIKGGKDKQFDAMKDAWNTMDQMRNNAQKLHNENMQWQRDNDQHYEDQRRFGK